MKKATIKYRPSTITTPTEIMMSMMHPEYDLNKLPWHISLNFIYHYGYTDAYHKLSKNHDTFFILN